MQESSELISPVPIEAGSRLRRLPFNWLLGIVLLIAGTAVVAPFYLSHKEALLNGKNTRMVPNTHDMAQHLAIMAQFDKVLRSGTFYPRWLPDVNNGYGLAWTNFYSPAFYYSTSLVNAWVHNWINSLFIISIFSFIASGLAFYLLSRQFYGQLASAAAALFYMVLPYHTLDLYWRGALPELQGFILVPLITYFAYKAGSRGKPQDYAGLGLCQGIYYMTHFPVAYLLTYTIALYGLIWAFNKRDWRIAFRIGLGMLLALVLSAIYWLPAVVESKYAQEHFTTIFPYHNSYITLLPATDRFGDLVNQSFAVQALALLISLAILRFAALQANQSSEREMPDSNAAASQTRYWMTLGLTTTFMVTSLSIYISKLIPKIEAVSFAMRWMVITSFFTALVAGAALDRLHKSASLPTHLLWAGRLALAVVVGLNLWVSTRHIIKEGVAQGSLYPPAIHYEPAFIPKGATNPRELPETADVVVDPANTRYEIVRWEPGRRELAIQAETAANLRLKTYNFYGWSARLDGQRITLTSDPDGIQSVNVPPGTHELVVAFSSTPPRTAAAALFSIAFLMICGLALVPQFRGYQRRLKTTAKTAKAVSDKADPVFDTVTGTQKGRPVIAALKTRRVILIGLTIGAALVILLLTTTVFRSSNQSKAPAAGNSGANLNFGAEATLQIPGREWVLVAVDVPRLNELVGALAASDEARVEALVQSDQVLRVAAGTKVRILELASSTVKIKILEGSAASREGWVPERWVSK
jgi:hypothetical protein